ncbi:hypothetical protein DFJ77DRAFT_475041 [Powellomyces hirtus]|nr:hypothetical protein DFJ77DRAFT_475041 [Powellomyces hirtus]
MSSPVIGVDDRSAFSTLKRHIRNERQSPQRRPAKQHPPLTTQPPPPQPRTIAKQRSRSFTHGSPVVEKLAQSLHSKEECENTAKRLTALRRSQSAGGAIKQTPNRKSFYLIQTASLSTSVVDSMTSPSRRRRTLLRKHRLPHLAISPLTPPSNSADSFTITPRMPSPQYTLTSPSRLPAHLEQRTYVLSYHKLLGHRLVRNRVPIANLMSYIHRVQPAAAVLHVSLSPLFGAHPASDTAARRRNRRRLERIGNNLAATQKRRSPLRFEYIPTSSYTEHVEDVTRDAVAKAEIAVRRMNSTDSLASMVLCPQANGSATPTAGPVTFKVPAKGPLHLPRPEIIHTEAASPKGWRKKTADFLHRRKPSGLKGLKRAFSCPALAARARATTTTTGEPTPSSPMPELNHHTKYTAANPFKSDRAAMRAFIGSRYE